MKEVDVRRLGLGVVSAGWIALGGLCLIMRDFLWQYEPVPTWVPRFPLATISAIVLVGCGVALLFARTRKFAASVLVADLLIWLLVLQPPVVLKAPAVVLTWLPFCEVGVLLSGALVILSHPAHVPNFRFLVNGRGTRLAQVLFALCCFEFAASHIVYSAGTAAFIPDWIPGRLFLAYFTGAGHLCAGLAILSGVQARLAARLEALMMSSFVLLVHVPSLFLAQLPFWAPDRRTIWLALFIAISLSGAAWLIAASIERRHKVASVSISAAAVA